MRKETKVSKMIYVSLQLLQMEVGIGTNILESPFPRKIYFGKTWLTAIWEFVSKKEIKLNMKACSSIPLRRVNDTYIMVNQNREWTRQQLIEVNHCRTWLRAMQVRDITSNSGTKIETWELYGMKRSHRS